MDPLLENSIQLAQKKAPGERLTEALELMEWGIAMRRQQLRRERPTASEKEIEAALEEWLCRDD